MLKQYLLQNLEDTKRLVGEINSYSGSLLHLEVFENDEEFFETFFCEAPLEAVRSALYGDYNYNDEYVKFDGYNNLESLDEYKYNKLIENNIDDIIIEARKYIHHLCISKEPLQELLEENEEEYIFPKNIY